MATYVVLEDVPGQRLSLGTRRGGAWITFDRARGIELARSPRHLRWLVGTLRIPHAQLEHVRLTVTPDHALALTIRHAGPRSMRESRLAFAVRDLDLDAEALDLAFRIARASRLDGFTVRQDRSIDLVPRGPVEDSPYRAGVLVPGLRSIDELAGATHATPDVVAPAAYAERTPFVEPEPPVPAVATGEAIAGVNVVAWAPPRVELEVPRTVSRARIVATALRGMYATLLGLVFLAVTGGAFEGCRRWTAEGLAQPGSSFLSFKDYAAFGLVVLVLLGLLGCAVLALFALIGAVVDAVRRIRAELRYTAARRVVCDGATVVVETRGKHETRPARDIRAVTLRVHVGAGNDDAWSELLVTIDGEEQLLLASPPSKRRAQQELARVAISLARLLDVPYRHIPEPQ